MNYHYEEEEEENGKVIKWQLIMWNFLSLLCQFEMPKSLYCITSHCNSTVGFGKV